MFPIISIVTLLQFCAPATSPSTSGSVYQEDLSLYREDYETPSFELEGGAVDQVMSETTADVIFASPTGDIKAELDTVINSILESREHVTTVDGFTIQLYSGSNRNRAYQVKSKVYDASDEIKVSVTYDQPNYKVRTGKYYTRLEANPDFELLRKHIPTAILVPSKIKID